MIVEATLKVDVRLFGRYRELASASAMTIELSSGATVADLVSELHRRVPGKLPERPVVAVDRQPAADDVTLRAGDEIALIPPVAGG